MARIERLIAPLLDANKPKIDFVVVGEGEEPPPDGGAAFRLVIHLDMPEAEQWAQRQAISAGQASAEREVAGQRACTALETLPPPPPPSERGTWVSEVDVKPGSRSIPHATRYVEAGPLDRPTDQPNFAQGWGIDSFAIED
ncbi:hypothetical protein [Ralstonia pseudosolanacearum]|uniref:hypothetical protein n=1 Tax=Ralstonia pseudosolanacearum TaxID=1310165 RepID=UPI001FFA4297|nr:hypothetical protein [Ralstonia pseudosolanacearum]